METSQGTHRAMCGCSVRDIVSSDFGTAARLRKEQKKGRRAQGRRACELGYCLKEWKQSTRASESAGKYSTLLTAVLRLAHVRLRPNIAATACRSRS